MHQRMPASLVTGSLIRNLLFQTPPYGTLRDHDTDVSLVRSLTVYYQVPIGGSNIQEPSLTSQHYLVIQISHLCVLYVMMGVTVPARSFSHSVLAC
jgi:hypothetical protein